MCSKTHYYGRLYSRRPIRNPTVDNNTVDANGRKIFLPNNVKRTSPGKRPTPSFSSQGNAAENTTSVRKIVSVQRIKSYFPLLRSSVATVSAFAESIGQRDVFANHEHFE